jgi:tocopherol O-methyltransferase
MVVLRPNQNYRSRPQETLHHDIRRFYAECTADIAYFWYDGSTLALHYGYWDPRTRTHRESLVNMNRELARFGRLARGCHVLDAGCGLGGSAMWIAETSENRVTGITLSEHQAAAGSNHVRSRNLSHLVTLEVADFCAMPFPDRTFDAVWALESVCHALSKRAFFAEAHRVLKPGGTLMMADGYANKTQCEDAEWATFQACFDGWHVPNLATKEELLGYFDELGFRDARFMDITENILPSATRMYRLALLAYPVEKLMEWMHLRTDTQRKNFITALKQHEVFTGEWAGYGMFVGRKAGVPCAHGGRVASLAPSIASKPLDRPRPSAPRSSRGWRSLR